jgi:type II secretory pathway component GspD/PulD (secretin)
MTVSTWIRSATGYVSTLAVLICAVLLLSPAFAQDGADVVTPHTRPEVSGIVTDGKVSLTLREVAISEVMEMLSKSAHVNILLSDDVKGDVSVNLYGVSVDEAINQIAVAAGYAVERRDGSYFIVKREEAGHYAAGGPTKLRTFKIQYSEPDVIKGIIEKYLSSYGKITTLNERKLLVVEDTPYFLNRISALLRELDRRPKQILIKAEILEITLKDSESYGLDWSKLFSYDGGDGAFGLRGTSNPGSAGLFFELVTPNIEVFLDTLRSRERLRTLATPKLLALEDQPAETLIGERLGYNVTTTINNVTTTSTEFLESGVILKVTPSVDRDSRVLLKIHPEVSTGTVTDDGIPNQKTTEVTTTMLVESGQTIFIGGLIRRNATETREGVPVLGDIPGLNVLFSNRAVNTVNTELVVLITPYIIGQTKMALDLGKSAQVGKLADKLDVQSERVNRIMDEGSYTETNRVNRIPNDGGYKETYMW